VQEMLVTAREILNEGDRVAERSLAAIPGTLEFRHQRLEKSSDFFDRLLARYPDDVELLNDSAVSHFRLASVAMHLGKRELANDNLDKAETQFQRLAETTPQNADYRFDLFHCMLTRSYLFMGEPAEFASLGKADQVISELVKEYPDDKRYLDAQICVRLKSIDVENQDHEERIRQIYLAAVQLKKKSPTPCLEWRHSGTAARMMTLHHLEQLDSQKTEEWLPIAEKETLEFLQRPNSVLDDRVDWIRYLEAAIQAAYLRADDESFHKLRRERLEKIEELLIAMPERSGFIILKQNESTYFDKWIKKAESKRTRGVP